MENLPGVYTIAPSMHHHLLHPRHSPGAGALMADLEHLVKALGSGVPPTQKSPMWTRFVPGGSARCPLMWGRGLEAGGCLFYPPFAAANPLELALLLTAWKSPKGGPNPGRAGALGAKERHECHASVAMLISHLAVLRAPDWKVRRVRGFV